MVTMDFDRFSNESLESQEYGRRKSMALNTKKTQVAFTALVITIILLCLSRLTTSWDLYNDSPFVIKVTPEVLPTAAVNATHPPVFIEPGLHISKVDGQPPAPESSSQLSNGKVAAILERRSLPNLVQLILHFSTVLGPEWPIYVFTSPENIIAMAQSAAFNRSIRNGHFHIGVLPESDANPSEYFTKPWFWEMLEPAEHVLLFNAESMICSRSQKSVEDYLRYDFIGAPIESDPQQALGYGYNGGLSLRNRKLMLDITTASSWEKERHEEYDPDAADRMPNVDHEDQWFWKKMSELPERDDGKPGAILPSFEVARSFSVQMMWEDRPLGYDQASSWEDGRMKEILEWCPEYIMALQNKHKDP